MKKILLLLCTLLGTVGAMATDVTVIDKTKDATTYGTLSGTTFTTNSASGIADVTIEGVKSTTATSFAYGACLGFTSVSSGTVTMTAPTGYIITGYTLTARSNTWSVPYTLTPSAGGSAVTTSTSGVDLSVSGLGNQTASFTYSAGSANSFYIPSLVITVVSEAANLVNVTYELYESDGTTLVNSVVKEQEENSAIEVPSSLTAPTYYDYATTGTIGSSDCTIKVTRTLKSGYVISLDGLSNSKCYNIRNNRGTWAVGSGATVVNSTVELGLAFSASDTKQQFAFITYEGNVYLYSVGEGKFAYIDGTKLSLTAAVTSAVEASPVTFVASTNATYMYSEPIIVAVNGSHFGVSTGYSPDIYKYQSQGDGGNCVCITEAGSFDATSALAALQEYFHPNYTVTYIVKDGNNNVLFTSDPVGTTSGTNITTLPDDYQLTNFYTYNTVDVTISASGNTDVEFIATPKENPLVKYTADASNPYYYNLNIRSKYLVYNSEAIGEVTLQNTSEPFNANASWAFIGEPYAGFKVINKTKGTNYFLTYTSVVTGGNGGSDGSNNNVQFVTSEDFNNRYWLIDKNTGGFCMRMKENTNIYFHHQNIANSNGYLRTCSVSEWSAVHNDAGSTIVASTDEDVLFALYNSMKDYSFGTAIGQYNTTDASVVTNEQATSTITGVGAAIAGSQTAAYADCYSALNTLAANIALVTPTAGFYRLKNVATGNYLTAIKATGYASTEKGVYANGDETSAATVIKLYDKYNNGSLYMYNQNHGFGWVVNDAEYGSGLAWVTSSPDKYVNWFPGNVAGQVGFAICYGNGTGSYASYLTKGIYTADTDEAVIGGNDYTADAAQWIVEPATSVTIALNAVGTKSYATTCLPFGVSLGGDVKAYALTRSGEWAVPAEIGSEVPANTPVLLVSETAATSVTATIDDAIPAVDLTNELVGNYFASTPTAYVLNAVADVPGFYALNGTLAANRAYLPKSTEVKGYAFNWGDADAIKAIEADKAAGKTIYNLAGQRVENAQKGIFIVNGKKVVIK